MIAHCAGCSSPLGTPRSPWNSNDAQLWCAFHKTTGVIMTQAKIADTYGAGCLSQCRCSGESTMNAATPLAVRIALYFDKSR